MQESAGAIRAAGVSLVLSSLALGSMIKSGAHPIFLLPVEESPSWTAWAWGRGDGTSLNPSFLPSWALLRCYPLVFGILGSPEGIFTCR